MAYDHEGDCAPKPMISCSGSGVERRKVTVGQEGKKMKGNGKTGVHCGRDHVEKKKRKKIKIKINRGKKKHGSEAGRMRGTKEKTHVRRTNCTCILATPN